MKTKDGKVMHAGVQIGDSALMLSDATGQYPAGASRLYLYVDNVDDTYNKAIRAKGTSLREPTDEFMVIDLPVLKMPGEMSGLLRT